MEARKCGSLCLSILYVWEACWAPPSEWFAEYSRRERVWLQRAEATKQRQPSSQCMVSETMGSVQQDHPAHGNWCVDGQDLYMWVDAGSLAIGVVDTKYILGKLDAVLKGVNLALQWQSKVLHMKTDSACMYYWVSNTLIGRARVHTKAASERVIRRRLNTLKDLINENRLTVDMTLVPSTQNIANRLTRVLQ